jgi:hypothetical protein
MSSHDSFAASGNSPTRSDFICENHGSIFLLRPISPASIAWIEEHLPPSLLSRGTCGQFSSGYKMTDWSSPNE